MSDDDLDRVLVAAVNVEHSADFLARVRRRVAQEQRPRWSFHWRLAAAGAALTAILVVTIVSWPDGERAVTPPTAVAASKAPSATAAPVPPASSAPRTTDSEPPVIPAEQPPDPTRRPPAAPRLPEALIAQEDAEAIRLLAALAAAGRLPAQLETDGVSTRDAVTLPRIDVPPIIVEPLAEMGRPEGDPQ